MKLVRFWRSSVKHHQILEMVSHCLHWFIYVIHSITQSPSIGWGIIQRWYRTLRWGSWVAEVVEAVNHSCHCSKTCCPGLGTDSEGIASLCQWTGCGQFHQNICHSALPLLRQCCHNIETRRHSLKTAFSNIIFQLFSISNPIFQHAQVISNFCSFFCRLFTALISIHQLRFSFILIWYGELNWCRLVSNMQKFHKHSF